MSPHRTTGALGLLETIAGEVFVNDVPGYASEVTEIMR